MISVVVPVYNKEEYLRETLKSLDKQTTDDFEVIIVNDKSTDHSMDIIREFKKDTNKTVKVYSMQENYGVSVVRNIGVKEANGNYITFLDADDYLDKDYIKIANLKLSKNPNIDILRAQIINVNGKKKVPDRICKLKNNEIIVPRNNRDYVITESAACNGRIFHSSLANSIDFTKSGYEDYEYMLEAMINCNKLLNVKNMKYYYRVTDKGRYKLENSNISKNCLEFINIHEKINNNYELGSFMKESLRLKKIKTCFIYLRMIKESNMSDSDKELFINLYLTYLKSHDGLDKYMIGDGRDIIDPKEFDNIKENHDYENIKTKIKQIASKY